MEPKLKISHQDLKEIYHASKEAINFAFDGNFKEAQESVRQICTLDDNVKSALLHMFSYYKNTQYEIFSFQQGLSKFIYRIRSKYIDHPAQKKCEDVSIKIIENEEQINEDKKVIKLQNNKMQFYHMPSVVKQSKNNENLDKWKEASSKLIEENKQLFQKNNNNYRSALFSNESYRAELIMERSCLDKNSKMYSNTCNNLSINPTIMENAELLLSFFKEAKIDFSKSGIFLRQAEIEFQILNKSCQEKTSFELHDEIRDIFCSFFCGKAIDTFVTQDLKSITDQKIKTIIKNITSFTLEYTGLKLNKKLIKNTITIGLLKNSTIESLNKNIEELSAAGLNYIKLAMNRIIATDKNIEEKIDSLKKQTLNELDIGQLNELARTISKSPIIIDQTMIQLKFDQVAEYLNVLIIDNQNIINSNSET